MKRLFTLAAVCAASFFAASCDKVKEEILPSVTITADETFNGTVANATLTLSSAAASDVTVTLASAAKASDGSKPIAVDYLTYEDQVVIKAGNSSATFVVTLDATSVAKGSEAAITIAGVTGAVRGTPDTAYIVYTGKSGGTTQSVMGEGSEPGWAISYLGYMTFTDEDGEEDEGEVFDITGLGDKYYYANVFYAGIYEEYVKGQDVAALVNELIEDDIETYNQLAEAFGLEADFTAEDFIYQGDARLSFYEFADGDYEFILFETSSTGVPTGKFAWCSFTKTGSSQGSGDDGGDDDIPELDVQMQLQENWSVEIVGEPYTYSDAEYIDVSVNLPGIKYYWLESNTQEELEYYYGSLEGLAASWQAEFAEDLSDGYTISELLWSASEPADWIFYYGGGETTIYVVEYDENGKATGRYGTSVVTLPEMKEATKIRVRVNNHKAERLHVRTRMR